MKFNEVAVITLLVFLAFSSYGLGRLKEYAVIEYAKLHHVMDEIGHNCWPEIA